MDPQTSISSDLLEDDLLLRSHSTLLLLLVGQKRSMQNNSKHEQSVVINILYLRGPQGGKKHENKSSKVIQRGTYKQIK